MTDVLFALCCAAELSTLTCPMTPDGWVMVVVWRRPLHAIMITRSPHALQLCWCTAAPLICSERQCGVIVKIGCCCVVHYLYRTTGEIYTGVLLFLRRTISKLCFWSSLLQRYNLCPNFTCSICCGFVVQRIFFFVQQIHNKWNYSTVWALHCECLVRGHCSDYLKVTLFKFTERSRVALGYIIPTNEVPDYCFKFRK